MPESCYACHGGFSHYGNIQEGSQYLPWDLALLKDWKGHKTIAAQEEDFRQLNSIVWNRNKSEIKTLIESWYDGIPSEGNVFLNRAFKREPDGSIIPRDASKKDWFTNPKGYLALNNTDEEIKYYREISLYGNVYAKYCRSCHVAQKTDWKSAVDFNIAAYRHVCNGRAHPVMPNAELTDDLLSNEIHTFAHGDTSTALDILCSQAPLKPDSSAKQVKAGRELFKSKVDDNGKVGGCIRCHESDDLSRNASPEFVATNLSCKVSVRKNGSGSFL